MTTTDEAGRVGVAPSLLSDGQALLYSVNDAARVLGIGRTLMWQMVRAERVPTVRIGRRVLVPREALEALATPDGGLPI